MSEFIKKYIENFNLSFSKKNIDQIQNFCEVVKNTIQSKNNIFICGNGGSAANSLHMANDFNLVLIKKKIQILHRISLFKSSYYFMYS